MLYFAIKFLAKSLLPSNCAPFFEGPMTDVFLVLGSFFKKSCIPLIKGISGPTKTISILCSTTLDLINSKSSFSVYMGVENSAAPAFGFIENNLMSFLDWFNFQMNALSLAPEPTIKIFTN